MADPAVKLTVGYIMHTLHGSFCTVCQSPLGCEEVEWDECDTCGGEGIGDDDDSQWQRRALLDALKDEGEGRV